jgi:hypothetical protein
MERYTLDAIAYPTCPLAPAFSFTDAEYAKLGELAKAAKLGRSEYIIEKLGLDKV